MSNENELRQRFASYLEKSAFAAGGEGPFRTAFGEEKLLSDWSADDIRSLVEARFATAYEDLEIARSMQVVAQELIRHLDASPPHLKAI